MKKINNVKSLLFAVLCVLTLLCSSGCVNTTEAQISVFDLSTVPDFSGEPYVEINGNIPYFTEDEYTTESYEKYGELDELGRCTEAVACIGQDLMPTEERDSISSVIPSGWENAEYDCIVGKHLYNRCHLIGFQLTGKNANEENLITGTRFLNTEGMLPFENMIADYIKETNNHVLYRVTPIFKGSNLVASGVLMEGYSIEDNGNGICFNVYCYNNQPSITIDYATGKSSYKDTQYTSNQDTSEVEENTGYADNNTINSEDDDQIYIQSEYILNTSTKRFHFPTCPNAEKISDDNKEIYSGKREELIQKGYEPCGNCNP